MLVPRARYTDRVDRPAQLRTIRVGFDTFGIGRQAELVGARLDAWEHVGAAQRDRLLRRLRSQPGTLRSVLGCCLALTDHGRTSVSVGDEAGMERTLRRLWGTPGRGDAPPALAQLWLLRERTAGGGIPNMEIPEAEFDGHTAPEETEFLAIELLDAVTFEPLSGRQVHVRLPEERDVDGTTGDRGVFRIDDVTVTGVAEVTFGDLAPEYTVEQSALVSTSVMFSVEDDDGFPVDGLPYEITLPDGSIRRGTVDEGRVQIEGVVQSGECELRFPSLGSVEQL